MSDSNVKNYCIICSRPTNHNILTQHVESERDEFARDWIYQIIQCAGCNYISFREVCIDLESDRIDETGRKCRVPESVRCYPKFIKNHKKINDTHYFPPEVANVYNEVIHSLQEEAFILASMGLRASVEAVCRDLGTKGRHLEQKIIRLAAEGHISKKDALRLSGIRFMGNDVSHEIVGPGKKDIEIALQIVEHLLSTVYILPRKIDGAVMKAEHQEHNEGFENLMTEEVPASDQEDEFPRPFDNRDAPGILQNEEGATTSVVGPGAESESKLRQPLTEELPVAKPKIGEQLPLATRDDKEMNPDQERYLNWRVNLRKLRS